MNEILFFLTFVLSFSLTIYGTPVAQKVAHRYNLLDFPDGMLKNQKKAIPYMGGVIVYFAFISPIGLLFPLSRELLGILFASSILLIVGLFDDLKALNPGIKFLFQMVSTFILIKSGIFIKLAFLPQWVNISFSFLWILATINAMNIIDILDGMASSVASLALLTIFIISLYNTDYLISVLSISLAGALLGFLKYNWEPAKIYLGDAGSMVVGLIIGALTIMGEYTTYNNAAFISGFLVLAIPFFDMIYVIILRLYKGKSPFFGSPDHFPLRIKKKWGLSVSKTVSFIVLIQLALSTVVIVNFYTTEIVTIITSFLIFIFFVTLGSVLAVERME
ncbi:MAG: MraY family glycosyltransferase [Acidobacteriota bacterium]